jgi:hypothetical protein
MRSEAGFPAIVIAPPDTLGDPPPRSLGELQRAQIRPTGYFPLGQLPFCVQLRCAPPLQRFFWSSFHPADAAVMVKATYNVANAAAMTRFISSPPNSYR